MAFTLALAPAGRTRIYCGGLVGASGAVFSSDDFGASWKRSTSPPSSAVFSIAVHPEDRNVAYAATSTGLFRSTDGGDSWTNACATTDLRTARLFPGCPDTIFAAGPSGVLTSTDRGGTWQDFNAGLTTADVSVLEFSEAGGTRLIAGTMGEACFAWSFPTGASGRDKADGVRRQVVVTPNPSAGRVSVLLPEPGPATALRLFDAGGRTVWQGELSANERRLRLDLSNVSPGVYGLRISSRRSSQLNRIVVVR